MLIKPVDITSKALKAINEIVSKKEIPRGFGLRIYIADKGISCGATNYSLGFDKQTEDDITYSIDGIQVIIKKTDAVHLAGLTLSYTTENDLSGFSFSREN